MSGDNRFKSLKGDNAAVANDLISFAPPDAMPLRALLLLFNSSTTDPAPDTAAEWIFV